MAQSVPTKRQAIATLLTQRHSVIPRPARLLLYGLVHNDALLAHMHFCRPEERPFLRDSVLVATEETTCWAVLLGNHLAGSRQAAQERARRILEGLDLTPGEILAQLQALPVWFLALDAPFAEPDRGEAVQVERTVYLLKRLPGARLRRLALLDQIDAALEAGDFPACERLRNLLPEDR